MSRKKRSKINFNPGVKDGVRKGAAYATTINEFGTSYTYNYNNQVYGEHNRSALVKVNKQGSWYRPAPYRVFAMDVDRMSFSFKYSTGTLTKVNWAATGVTDTANGFGTSFHGYLGTRLAGGLRIPDVSQNFENQVVTEAMLKLQNGDLNLLTSLAESVEAVTFIASLLRSLAKLLDKFCRDPVKRKTKLKKRPRYRNRDNPGYWTNVDLGSGARLPPWKLPGVYIDGVMTYAEQAWLSTMYAMFPLISEVEAAMAALESGLGKPGAHISALRSMERSVDLPTRPFGAGHWGTKGFSKIGCECQLNMRLALPDAAFWSNLGLDNPLALFWEVTPFSFVVDWLIPVANTLKALTAPVGLDFESGFINHLTWSDFEVSYSDYPQMDPGDKMPTVRYRNVCQLRTSLVTTPLPGFYFKNPFSTSHTISALALIGQLLSYR